MRRYEVIVCLALLVAGVIINYRPVVLNPNGRENVGMLDAWSYFGPNAYFMDRSLHRGEFPLWNRLVLCGVPFAANPQTKTFYPPNLVRSALNFGKTPAATHLSLKLLLVFHMLVAGLGTFALGRTQGLSVAASLLAAYAFVFGASFVRRVCAYHFVDVVAWLPWELYFIERTCTATESPALMRSILLGSITLALCALAGYVQLTMYVGLTAGVYVICRQLARDRVETPEGARAPCTAFARNLGAFVTISIGAMLLAAVALVPAAQLFQLSQRASANAVAGGMRLGWLSLREVVQLVIFPPGPTALVPGVSSGALVVLMSSAIWTADRRRALPWALLILPLIDLTIGPPMPVSSIVEHVSRFRLAGPHHAFIVLCLPLSLLGGFGADALARDLESRTQRPARAALTAVMALGLTALMWRLRDRGLAFLAFGFNTSMVAPRATFAAPLAIAALPAIGMRARTQRWITSAAFAIIVIELALWNARYVPHLLNSWAKLGWPDLSVAPRARPPENVRHTTDLPNALMYTETPALAGYEPAMPAATWRAIAAGEDSGYARTITTRDAMLNNTYGSVLLWRPFRLARTLSHDTMPSKDEYFDPSEVAFVPRDIALTQVPASRAGKDLIAQRGSVTAVLSAPVQIEFSTARPARVSIRIPEGTGARALRVTYTSSAAGMMWPEFADAVSGGKSFARLRRVVVTAAPETIEFPLLGGVAPKVTLNARTNGQTGALHVLHVEVIANASDDAGHIDLRTWMANSVTVRVRDLEAPRLLVFTDTIYPGWRAYVDGQRAPIVPTDGAFKSVEVPAGTHEVRFVFRPASVALGLAISGVALIGVCALFVRTATAARTALAVRIVRSVRW